MTAIAQKARYHNGEEEADDVNYYCYIRKLRKPILELFGHFGDLVALAPLQRVFETAASHRRSVQQGNRSMTDFFSVC